MKSKGILVSKGFQCIHEIDYDETCYPVENMDSIRLSLFIATTWGWEVYPMDVKNNFLHRDLSKDI
jgi:hypothetical protein